MTTYAYNPIYLDRAGKVMGNMLHDAVYEFHYDGNDFLQLFIQSEVAEEMENGNPKYIAGMSGGELFSDVIRQTTDYMVEEFLVETYERSDAYWVGWALAHYQWYSGRSFRDILDTVSFNDLISLYGTLHEADAEKIYEVLEAHFEQENHRLKRLRKYCAMTQEELSEESGVSLNTLRAYERNAKDVHKAQADIILRLARALKCNIDDIIG